MIVGFSMAIHAGDAFGAVPVCLALAAGFPPAWRLSNRLSVRDLLIAIYLAWAVGMVLSLVAFGFPDQV